MPLAPARPVRPERWTYVSQSALPDMRPAGGCVMMTKSTPLMSSPRAATSVATMQRMEPFLNAARHASRAACGTSPCSALHSSLDVSAGFTASSSASFLVSTNTIVRPSAAPP